MSNFLKTKYSKALEIIEETGKLKTETIDDGDIGFLWTEIQNAGYEVELSSSTDYLLCTPKKFTGPWEREGYSVEMRDFDYDLKQFAVIVLGKKEQLIIPGSIESMNSIIEDLNNGEDVDGWEDGMGNTIYTDPEFLEDAE